MKNLFTIIFIWIASVNVFSAVIFTNPITGTNPNTSNPYTIGQSFDANVTVSGIGRGTGISGANANDRYNASSWNTTSIDLDAYFELTITPNTDYLINFTNFVYTGQASGTGATSFAFRSSIDGFLTNIGSPNVSGTTISLAGSEFQGILSAITFRFYGWGASAGAGTFSINDFTFNGIVDGTLPINLTQFNAFFQNKAVQLNWSKSDAVNFDKFVVEHSTDGSNFVMLEEVAARTSTDYAVSHQNPTKGTNYYRLKLVDRDGSFAYSAVKTVSVKAENGWSIYPSKVNAQLTATLAENDDAVVCILNTNGQILAKVEANGSTLVELPVGNLAAGLYLVQILEKGNLVYTQKFIKE